ncbi:MAG TPA: ThuA domain-containing protein [Pseudonocardiaceae bacterium]|jgi:hypothetical protein|nr:ThuA domain-containing protein [Pseudonocardiaceae bacterium]
MTGRTALVVRGGWDGHFPVEATDRYAAELRARDYQVTVSDSLDSYLDVDLLAASDLIVQCWTMGTITREQLAGLSAAVRAGTGFAGWHGGIIDSFRAEPDYHLITGGQFVHHPKGFVDYTVRPVSALVADLDEFAVHTELYTVHIDPSIEIQAVTGTAMPVTWTKNWGEGKVFVTTLGHHPPDFEVPETHEMIIRGLLWATR